MNGKQGIYNAIRNFLFSSANKEFLIFLFFLSLSGIFWLMMTLNETYEKEFKLPVRIINIPNNVVLTSDATDTVKLTLHDKGLALIRYMYGKELRTLKINFKPYSRNNGVVQLTAADIQRIVYQQLPASTRITAIKPDKLDFYYNYGLCKRVPLRWSGRVIPEHLYFISHIKYWPDSISVYAPKEKLDSINYVYTEPLNYANFRDTLIVNCNLQKQKGVKMVPDRVKIGFYTDVLTEESISDIPIVGINMPEGKTLRTFPSKVTVSFVTGVSQFRKLRPSDFRVVVDYRDIARHPSEKCTIHLKNVPHGISRAKLNLQQVDYLIEEGTP
ncbi:YbbR-like domain-containing protein [Xylanibacter muris]|uniref:YbbR-like domain-containing protein n=1 Tax=Xylanibacter muris TaxID=2736290 RepID=A0ABX2APP1_9BACT|nr:YbbR-like domain-containing protein [Xylanibacter muris]NPD92949.1 YbbR-like domain-containing protein [Xylanibacter muris]